MKNERKNIPGTFEEGCGCSQKTRREKKMKDEERRGWIYVVAPIVISESKRQRD